MNPSRTRAVRLLTGSAAGALALGALAMVPAPATAAAVPDRAGLVSAAPVASAAAPRIDDTDYDVARKATREAAKKKQKAKGSTDVKNQKQLRKAVAKANKRSGTDKIVLTSTVRLKGGSGKGNGARKGDLDVTDDLVVEGGGFQINAKGVDRIFDVTSGVRLDVKNVTLKRGIPAAGESGGAVRGTGATVVLSNVTANRNRVTGVGASGGAIMNDDGVLVVRKSDLVSNSAFRAGGAIEANAGSTTVNQTLLGRNSAGDGPGNGGAIHLTGDGTVSVNKSEANLNIASAEGGAFWNSLEGIFAVTGTTFEANEAKGAAADEGGGALYNDGGALFVVTSQMLDNTASGTSGSGGAIFNNDGELGVENSTMSGNSANRAGGAIEANAGTTEVLDSAMRGNAAGSNPGNGGALHLSGAGTVLVSGGRVVDNTASAEGGGLWNSAPGSMEVAQVTVTGNTAAGAAADNGGGGLYNDGGTMMVRGSSLESNDATGAAGSGGGILNNLGDLTVVNSTIDSGSANRAGGAIEANEGTTTIVRSSLESNSAGAAPGNGGAVHLTGPGAVVVRASSFGANTASAEGGALWNSVGGTMSIERSDIVGNTASGADADQGGGGVYTDGGDLFIVDSDIRENSADGAAGSGGGVLNNQATVEIVSSTLMNNNAVRAGGGVEANAGSTTIRAGSVLSNNLASAAPGNGGALHLSEAGTVDIVNTEVSGNTAALEGGGLWNSAPGVMTVTGSDITGNEALGAASDNGGGGLYNDGGDLTVTDSTVSGNSASGAAGSGGGALSNTGTLAISGSTFDGNDAQRAGGAIENLGATVTIEDSTLSTNATGAAPGNGGGLHTSGAGDVTVTDSAVTGNTAAAEGGGLWNSGVGTMTVTGTLVDGNSAAGNDATQGGGGLFQQDGATGTLTVTDSVVSGNSATGTAGSGGGLLNDAGGTVTITGTEISGNDAQRAGGGIENNAGTVTIDDSVLSTNAAGAAPGYGGGL
ncbi:MAG: hypothetical protein OSB43_18920, partial [Nocardioides sp.]|uniref:beta strand repeat-containing protein n=1 Tax=Nocardioides sp. TaxID=35761 RepID=UPI002383D79A